MTTFYLIGGASGVLLLLGFLVLRYRKKLTEMEMMIEEYKRNAIQVRKSKKIREAAARDGVDANLDWLLENSTR